MASVLMAPHLRILGKILKIVAISLLTLLLVLILMLWCLIFTEAGTRQLFSTLAHYELLSYQSLEGSISGGLHIGTLNFKNSSLEIDISTLSLSADWNGLLYSKVQINELSATRVDLKLPPSKVSIPSQQPSQQDFNLDFVNDRLVFIPLELVLKKLSIAQLNISQLKNSNEDQTYQLHDIQLTGIVDQHGIHVDQLDLRYQQSALQLVGSILLAPKLAIDLTLHWTAQLLPSPDTITLAGNAQLNGDSKQLLINHQSRGSVESNLTIKLSNWLKHPQLVLQGTIAKLAWPLASKTPPQLTNLILSAEGDLSSVQSTINGQLLLHQQGQEKSQDQNQLAFELHSVLSQTKVDISSLRFTDNSGGSVQIQAQLNGLDSIPQWQSLIKLQSFDGRTVHSQLPEQLTGTLDISGSFDRHLQLDIATNNLHGVLQERFFDTKVNLQVAGEKVHVQQLQAQVGDNHLVLSGIINKTIYDLKFDSQLNDLTSIITESKGAIQVAGTLTGIAQKPTLKVQVEGQQLKLYDFSVDKIKLTTNFIDGVLVKDNNYLSAKNLRYQSLLLDQLTMTAEGSWLQPTLALTITSPLLQINAQTELQLDTTATIHGQLNRLQLKGDSIGDWQLQDIVDYNATAEDWSLSKLCLQQDSASACLEASGLAGKLSTNLKAQQLPLSLLNAIGLLDTAISGLLDIDANFSGDDKQNQGWLRVTQSRVGTPLLLIANSDAVDVSASVNSQVSITDFVVEGTIKNNTLNGYLDTHLNDTGSLSGEFEIRDLLSDHNPLQARVDYNIPDLSPYASLIPEIDDLAGELSGSITLGNSVQQPQLSLFTRLDLPRIYISPLAIEWHNLTAEITTLLGTKQQLKASVNAGDGQLNLTGTLSFESVSNWISELHIKGENALLMDQPDRRVLASPDLHITATAERLEVQGLLRIPKAKLEIKPSPSRLSLTSDAVIHDGQDESISQLTPYRFDLNLDVLLGDSVKLEAYGLTTDVTGKLTLTKQSPEALLGYGELNLVNGAYQAYGQDLTIERGIIRFTGMLSQPEIELTASRSVKNVKAGLRVNGSVSDLRTQLYSEPSLPDSDILSYIIRGKALDDTTPADQNALANALLTYSISQSTPITAKLTALSGLDDIGLEAEEGIETLGLTLGKYITPRLYARYGIGVIDKLSKVFLQYRLSDKLYLETESGVGQSVDLMYRSR